MATTEEQLVVRAELRGQLAEGLREVGAEARQAHRALHRMTGRQTLGGFERFQRRLSNVGRVVNGLGRGVATMGRGVAAGSRGIASLGRVAGNAVRPLASLTRTAVNLGQAIGLAAAGGIAALATMGIRATADAEMMQVAFEGITGSAARAQELMIQMRAFAARTPFEIPEVTSALQRVLAIQSGGFATDRDPFDILETVGNVTSLFGGGPNELNAVMRAIGQIAGSGRLMAQDLNQITQALPGFNVRNAIAGQLGITQPELMDLAEQGLVPAQEALTALLNGMAAYPGAVGAMDRASQTLTGLWSTFKDSIRIALIDGIEPFLPQLKDIVRGATPLFESLVRGAVRFTTVAIEWGQEIWPGVKAAVSTAWRGVRAVITNVAWPILRGVFDFVQEHWPSLERIFLGVGRALQTAWTDYLGPALEALGAGLGRVIDWVGQHWPQISGYINGAFQTVKAFWDNTAYPLFQDVYHWFVDNGPTIAHAAQEAWQAVSTAITSAWNIIRGPLSAAIKLLDRFLTMLNGALEAARVFDELRAGANEPGAPWWQQIFQPWGGDPGDTARPRARRGGGAGVLAGLAGGNRITNVGFGAYAGSDHLAGRAIDVAGPFAGRFQSAVRAIGGFAERHGSGAGRHVHAAYGDTVRARAPIGSTPRRGGGPLILETGAIQISGASGRPEDIRRAVLAAMRQVERDRRERG